MPSYTARGIQLKSVARSLPDQPARQVVLQLWLVMRKAAKKNLRRVSDLTIRACYRELAKLGGFLGRKSDGESAGLRSGVVGRYSTPWSGALNLRYNSNPNSKNAGKDQGVAQGYGENGLWPKKADHQFRVVTIACTRI